MYRRVSDYVWPRSRLDGSCSSFSALDLSNAGSGVHAVHLSPTLLPQPEERQALCQHGGEKHVYQRPAARSRWRCDRSSMKNSNLISHTTIVIALLVPLCLFFLCFFWTGISFNEAKLMGLTSSQGMSPVPREMTFPVPKGSSWHDLYDYIRYIFTSHEHAPFLTWVLKANSKRLNLHIHFTTISFRETIDTLKCKLLL